LLLELGADIHALMEQPQCTALHCAAIKGHKDTVAALLEMGAEVNAQSLCLHLQQRHYGILVSLHSITMKRWAAGGTSPLWLDIL
jgi:ankyrin repeat protein